MKVSQNENAIEIFFLDCFRVRASIAAETRLSVETLQGV
jgi:hypothetical protein